MIKTIFDILFDISLFVNAIIMLPQLVRILRSKVVEGLSLTSFAGIFLLQLIMAIHGYFYHDFNLMIGMFFAMIVSGSIAALIVFYGKILKTHS